MEIKKIFLAIIVMYILHLLIANWSVIKQAIIGTYQGGFVFFDFKLLIMCFIAFLSVQIIQFGNNGKK